MFDAPLCSWQLILPLSFAVPLEGSLGSLFRFFFLPRRMPIADNHTPSSPVQLDELHHGVGGISRIVPPQKAVHP